MSAEDDLSKLYQSRFPEDSLQRKHAIWKILCEKFFSQFVRKTDTVVDLACGYGEFLNHIEAKRRVGVDLNPDGQKFLQQGIEFFACNASQMGDILPGQADIIFTSNFLEHLPHKEALELLLAQVKKTLKPKGKFLILGPNIRYLPGKYWDYYDHHLALSHLSLGEALQLHGFKIDFCLDKFLPYTTKTSLPTHPWLVALYLKIPLAWRILGKQFFIVASRSS